MALRHAVLAALLEGELSGYQLAKAFDAGVANFWHARPQQLYAELKRLESQGLVTGREIVQHNRPNKRLFTVSPAGVEELRSFTRSASGPSAVRDDLLVKVQACDHVETGALLEELGERAELARTKVELFESLLAAMRGERSEEEHLARAERVGPYLTCLRGRAFEQGNQQWCERVMGVLRARQEGRGDG
ncbi:PadR family transcriptional regulator [Nocardiopsis sp. HNM0947]|uniref:PadR family transcriptional regulator n=1 Tax=Nocardiopsis coralli TaxID=2772213 RepID=A0ABR9P6V3_9ACTN|nr:PadR family transcriptional regulator [Nocardiopsis coralli]MBE2999575.1 PadR family transcriptional regulator [Nocardiopsis coralli]